MKKNIKNKKGSLLFIGIISIILLLILFISLKNTGESIQVAKQSQPKKLEEVYYLSKNNEAQDMCKYLSDIEYVKDQSSVEWGSITLDSNLENQYNNGLITLIVEGKKTHFLKGVSAHATSTLVYNITDYDYDYFSTYVGVDESRANNGNGVKFEIYTSKDGNTWELKSNIDNKVLKATDEAVRVTVDIKDANYIKLYCNKNGNNASDHSVYADAKLYKEGYEVNQAENVDFIKKVEEYDEILKNQNLENQINGANELVLLQRTFVNNVGYSLLQAIVNQNENYMEAVKWLMEDVENLRLYVLGGEPDGGSYYNSIKELSRLYSTYKKDFEDKTLTHNKWYPDLTKGEVYKKMAISLSLTHATKVGYWAQIDEPSNRSDSVKRYAIYKELYDEGKFIVARNVSEDGAITPRLKEDGSPVQDHTPWFEALTIEEMRYVMNNITDDEELIWFNDYTQKRIDANPGQEEKYLQPHTYIAYVWPDFENPIFHDQDLKDDWDKLFEGIFSKYNVTYSTEDHHVYKAWMSMRNEYGTGAVCGGISKLGCHIRAAHGTPASVIGQPGHAALIYYRKTEDGKGYWTIDNDVSGWAQSGKTERLAIRMPLGWGNDSYVDGYAATYIVLAQEAMNDNVNYEKAEKIMMTANLYEGDPVKQEQIYREALKVQKINLDAWWGLINSYKANSAKTEADYYKLAEELGEALMPFPLPMKNLLDQISEKITSIEYSFPFTLLETKFLNEGKTYESTDVVLQPSITRTVANFLLGQTDTALASFSFDGVDANKIVLSSRYDNTGVRWDYSLDGKQTWKEVSFEADKPHKWQLTEEEIESITAENDICIHIVGTDRENDANIYRIDIEDQEPLANLYANDLENRVVGVNTDTHWRYTENDQWTSYNVASPDLTGNKTVQVRQGATGTKLASSASEIYNFTEDNQPEERKYIRVSELEVHEYLSQSVDGKRPYYAPNAIDGNIHTIWHTDFRYNVITENTKPFYTIKLTEPKYISAVEFIQQKYKVDDPDDIKDVVVYVSMNGEDWTEAGRIENCTNYGEWQKIDFSESVQAQYVKLDIGTYNMFASLAMVNLFEDVTKIDRSKPTAGIYYSTQEPTSDYVIARLDDPSTEIIITNNDGHDTYVFTENGEFTFEFEDKNGNKGSATAKVDWIDKSAPTADVDYKLDGDKKLRILLDSISEDVYLLDKDNNKINYIQVKDNKVSNIAYLDSSGNVYKVTELDADGNILKATYTNTTGKVSSVDTYVTTLTNGVVTKEEFLDENGVNVELKEEEKDVLRKLQQVKTNPLEYTFEESGNYEFKLLDKASNIAYKSIKADYLEDNNIIASDISYDITKLTNKDVVATINPYIINNEGKKLDVKMVNDNAVKEYKFEDNGEFVFKYKDPSDNDDVEVKEHTAKVDWIDKDAPTATIKYSTDTTTNEPVTASLEGESEAIIITNNSMSREYTFTENGSFTFKFEDEAGNEGTAVATVNWIEEKQEEPDEPQQPENPDEPQQPENPDEPIEIVTGDIDKDGEINSTDLIALKRHLIAGQKQEWILTEEEFKAADINQDGKITATDLLLMKRLVLKQKKEQ